MIITSDNPRSEDPLAIMESATRIDGCGHHSCRAHCRSTCRHCGSTRRRPSSSSLVVIAGKGHETTQTFADRVEHFDDAEVAVEEWARLAEDGDPR